jgi:RNA polymerase sigma-70 factor (ECF subfamily)
MATPLCDSLLQHLPEGAAASGASDALERRLVDLCAAGEGAWPALDLRRADVVAYVAGGLSEAADVMDVDDATAAEMYLACGCSRGDATALAKFEAHYLSAVTGAVAHMKLSAALVDDVRQQVREKLLVSKDGARPKIDDYAAQGRLRGLVCVVAVRTAISALRKTKREVHLGDDDLAQLPTAERDPELAYMKEMYRAEFKTAFEQAVRALESRDRNLLRMHLLSGVTLEKLADMYGVHRATVVRWLAKVRKTLFTDTRKRMRARLEVSPTELDSLMRLIESRLDVSVQRMLHTIDEPNTGDQ